MPRLWIGQQPNPDERLQVEVSQADYDWLNVVRDREPARDVSNLKAISIRKGTRWDY